MNILIISAEAWRDTNNGGNVLSNIFAAFPEAHLAQIYCSGEMPQNSICRNYFQISDSMLLSKEIGRSLEIKDYSEDHTDPSEVIENTVKNKVPNFFREAALLAREGLWSVTRWKTEKLECFIRDFNPDIIFAPCYSYFHISKLALHVKRIAGCPMISYISDDNYSMRHFRFSVFFWINRLITRKWIRRHFAASTLVYTMTRLQKEEYERKLGTPMKVLCKSASFAEREKEVGSPVRLIYAGGLYLNRWKILAKISDALDEINQTEVKAELHVFSGSQLRDSQKGKLNDGKNSFLHSQISYEQLVEQYSKSDVALHVEAFDLKNRCSTRLSFSTKIIDCMSSGCAILAVGPETNAGISYLKENDAAICVNDPALLYSVIRNFVEHPEVLKKYSFNAARLGRMNHCKSDIEKGLRQDFYDIAKGSLEMK